MTSPSRLIRQIEQAGNEWTCTYDANNNLTTRTYPLGNRTSYTYTATGQIASKTDPNGHTATYGYDAFDAVNRTRLPHRREGRTVTYTYDGIVNATAIEYREHACVTCTYDAANRLRTVTDWGGRQTSYEYTRGGLLYRVVRPRRSAWRSTTSPAAPSPPGSTSAAWTPAPAASGGRSR